MAPSNEQIRDAITEQAADWFVANQAGALSDQQRSDFVAWLRISPTHVDEYLHLASIARVLPEATSDPDLRIEELVAEARDAETANVTRMPRRRLSSGRDSTSAYFRWSLAFAVPAGLAMLAVAATLVAWAHRGDWFGAATVYASAHGERATVSLPDGSSMQLNADSAATVRYDLTERQVELTRGQALFSVAHGSRRPFRVVAGAARVVAVGTQFDVDRRADAAIVTVLEGRVLVSAAPPAPSAAAAAGAAPARTVAVTAGRQLRVEHGIVQEHASVVDLKSVEGWQRGQIVFDRRPLGEVADDFNRYSPVRFQIDDAGLRAELISGNFDATDFESFALFLKSLNGVALERSAEQIRVTRSTSSASGAGSVPVR